MRTRLRSIVGLTAIATLASCMSYRTARPVELEDQPKTWDPLPYHVAIVPLNASEVICTGENAEKSGSEFNFEFGDVCSTELDEITRNLEAVLRANAFSEVTVLPPPTEEEYALLGDDGLASYWTAAAREHHADLLLDVNSFEYPTKPSSGALWHSYALFLTGPLELMFPDRKYEFDDVSLAVTLYDVSSLGGPPFESRAQLVRLMEQRSAGNEMSTGQRNAAQAVDEFALGTQGGVVRQFRVRPEDLRYRFGDRLGKGATSGSFWTSVIVPSALLQNNSEHFSSELTTTSSRAIAKDLAREIAEGDYEFIVQPSSKVDGLEFDARNVRIIESPKIPGALELHARLRRPNSGVSRPTVRIGAAEYDIRVVEDAAEFPSNLASMKQICSSGAVPALLTENRIEGDRMDHDLVILLPGTSLIEAAAKPLPERAPTNVVQLRLNEQSGNRSRMQSWTFSLDGVLDPEELDTLVRRSKPQALDAAPIEASSDTKSASFVPSNED